MNTSSADKDRQGLAIALIVITSIAISFGDVFVKIISADMVIWQIFVLRAAMGIPVLILLCRLRSEPISLLPDNVIWTSIRTLLMILMWLVYYAAFLKLPVSDVAAAYYTMPIFVTLLAAIVIGDKIGIQGWIGVGIGFIGVLLIVKPNNIGFSVYILLPLIAAFLFAVAMIITRTKCRNEHPYVLALNMNILFFLTGLIVTMFIHFTGGIDEATVSSFFGGPWKIMALKEWIAIAVLAGIMLFVSVGGCIAYQVGRPSVVATFSFSYVPFAAIWGILLLGETPTLTTLLGIVLIMVAGILTVWR